MVLLVGVGAVDDTITHKYNSGFEDFIEDHFKHLWSITAQR